MCLSLRWVPPLTVTTVSHTDNRANCYNATTISLRVRSRSISAIIRTPCENLSRYSRIKVRREFATRARTIYGRGFKRGVCSRTFVFTFFTEHRSSVCRHSNENRDHRNVPAFRIRDSSYRDAHDSSCTNCAVSDCHRPRGSSAHTRW